MLKGLNIGFRMFHRTTDLTQTIVWVGQHLKAIQFHPPAMGRDTSHSISLLQPKPFSGSQSSCEMGTSSGRLELPARARRRNRCVEPGGLQCLSCWDKASGINIRTAGKTPQDRAVGQGWGSERAALFAPSPPALGIFCRRQWL